MTTVLDARVVTGSGGGPDKTILNQPRFLEPFGYRNVCAYLAPPNDPGFAVIEEKAKHYSAPLVRIDDRGPLDWRVIRDLVKLCKRENVAIWHGHDYKTNALGLIVRRFHRMRLVTTAHGWVEITSRTPTYYKIDRWCLRRYEHVFCVSTDLVEECRNHRIANLELIDNAIDTEDYRRQRNVAEAKAKLGLGDAFLFGAVGRLSEEKGFDVLLRAIQPLLNESTKLIIVGEGKARPQLEALISELGLTAFVLLPGWRADACDVYEAMDAYVLSSRREGLPNVLLEAMALEVPVIATAVNGVPRLVRDAVDGRLVKSENVEELRAAMVEFRHEALLRARLSAAGRARVVESFSFPARMAKIAARYDALLGVTR